MSQAVFIPLDPEQPNLPSRRADGGQPEIVDGLTVNDDIIKPFSYLNAFSPEECATLQNLPIDAALTQKALLEQQTYLQGFRQYMQGQIGVPDLRGETGQAILKQISGLLQMLNQRHYHFELGQRLEIQRLSLQSGQEIDWHFELGDFSYSTRKLALVIFLSDQDTYGGGAFEIMSRGTRNIRYHQGSIITYPAYAAVRIQKLTHGQMHLLTAWIHGSKPFY